MTIPVYRHNLDHDDWEVASVYDSDDCESMGRSGYDDDSTHCAGSSDDPVLRLQSILQDEIRPRAGYHQFPQQQQHQKYASATSVPRWDARLGAGKLGGFTNPPPPVVPPPGIIFPPQEWVYPPREAYMPPVNSQTAPDPNVGLIEPPPSFSLAPPPPSRSLSPLMRRSSPSLLISHGRPLYSSSGTGNKHASPITSLPLHHELPTPPRLADAGSQAPPGIATNPSRRAGHEVLPSYAGPAQLPRGQPSEDFVQDVHYSPVQAPVGSSGALSPRLSYGSGERGEPLQASARVSREYDPGRNACGTRAARPQTRERRPSIWQRFVRRFSPSRVSVGQS